MLSPELLPVCIRFLIDINGILRLEFSRFRYGCCTAEKIQVEEEIQDSDEQFIVRNSYGNQKLFEIRNVNITIRIFCLPLFQG